MSDFSKAILLIILGLLVLGIALIPVIPTIAYGVVMPLGCVILVIGFIKLLSDL